MKAKAEIRVRYAETDRMGAAYYANYFVWFEVGRTTLLNELGIPYKKMEDEFDCILPVVEAHCRYRKVTHFDDLLTVETQITEVSRKALTFTYTIYRGEELIAEGYTKHVNVNHTGKVHSFPEEILSRLQKAKDENG